jgi:DNA-damage-inducible protein J
MAKTASLNIRLDPETKTAAERVFSQFDMTLADAVNIFLRKSVMTGGFPFDLKSPRYSEETLEAVAEVKRMRERPDAHKGYADVEEMIRELLS